MEEEASGAFWETSGKQASRRIKEQASGSIWGYLGSLWEASWRHLGGIWGTQGIWRHRGGPLKQEVYLPSLKCSQPPRATILPQSGEGRTHKVL